MSFLLLTLLSSMVMAFPVGAGHDTSAILGTSPDSPEAILSVDGVAGKGNRFTKKQKDILKKRNADANDGKVLCEKCDAETVAAEKHEKNVTPPKNEAHTDHKVPRAKGGKADLDNGQVLCRDCNLKKSDKTE
jgi:hypothetical protein